MNSLGKNIHYYRNKKGLTSEQLGRLLSVSSDLILLWEKGERLPSEEMLDKMATIFGIETDALKQENAKEKVTQIRVYKPRGKLIGVCARCGKSIYANDKYGIGSVRKTTGHRQEQIQYHYDPSENEGYDYFCEDCCQEIVSLNQLHHEEKYHKMERRLSKARIGGVIASIVGLGSGLLIAFLLYFLTTDPRIAYVCAAASLVLGYYAFSLIYTLIIRSDWIAKTIYGFAKMGYKSFPRHVSERDAQGVLKNFFIAFLFYIATYLAVSIVLAVLTIILGMISMFSWPSAKLKHLRKMEEMEAQLHGQKAK